jgi:hypothetical protein
MISDKIKDLFDSQDENWGQEHAREVKEFRDEVNRMSDFHFGEKVFNDIADEVSDIDERLSDMRAPSLAASPHIVTDVSKEEYVDMVSKSLEESEENLISDFSNAYLGITPDSEYGLGDLMETLRFRGGNLVSELREIDKEVDFQNSPIDNEQAIQVLLNGRSEAEPSANPNQDLRNHVSFLEDFLNEDITLDEGRVENIAMHDPGAADEVVEHHDQVRRSKLMKKALKQMGQYKIVNNRQAYTRSGLTIIKNEFPTEDYERSPTLFKGDEREWERLTEEISGEDIKNLSILGAKPESIESIKDLELIEEQTEKLITTGLGEVRETDVSQAAKNTENFPNTNPLMKADLINKHLSDVPRRDWQKHKRIQSFGETLDKLQETHIEINGDSKTAYNVLMNHLGFEKNLEDGKTIFSDGRIEEMQDALSELEYGGRMIKIAKERDYSLFIENEAQAISDLLEGSASFPELKDILRDTDSGHEGYESWSDILNEAFEENSTKLKNAIYVSEKAGEEFEPGAIGWLSGKAYQKKNLQEEFEWDADPQKVIERVEKEIAKALPEKYAKAISNIGKENADQLYNDLKDEEVNIDEAEAWEIAGLKIYRKAQDRKGEEWRGSERDIEKLMELEDRVYEELERNSEWLNDKSYDEKDIIDPRLEEFEGAYERNEDHRKDSALVKKMDKEDADIDIEEEKEGHWENEIKPLLEDIGTEPTEINRNNPKELQRYVNNLDNSNIEDDRIEALNHAVNDYMALDNILEGVPDQLTMYVASPTEKLLMGKGFASCHDPEASHAWASAENSISPNTMVFYAEDEEGVRRGRTKAFITEQDDLVYHNLNRYKNAAIDMSDHMHGYMEAVASHLELDLKSGDEINYTLEEHVDKLERDSIYLNE